MHPNDDPADDMTVPAPTADLSAPAGGLPSDDAEHVDHLGEPLGVDPSGAPTRSEPGSIPGVRDQQSKPPSRRTIGDSVISQGQNGQGSQGRV